MKKTLEEKVNLIIEILDEEYGAFIPDCGSDFCGEEGKGCCEHYHFCRHRAKLEALVNQLKEVK